MEYLVGVVAFIALVAAYVVWLSGRIGRLQARVCAAELVLDAQLTRRANVAAQLAHGQRDTRPEASGEVCAAVKACLEADPDQREAVENDLTRALAGLALGPSDPVAAELVAVSRRLAVARQVHNDAVRDTLGLRGQRIPRALRLGARHPEPRYFDVAEFDGRGFAASGGSGVAASGGISIAPSVGEATPGAS